MKTRRKAVDLQFIEDSDVGHNVRLRGTEPTAKTKDKISTRTPLEKSANSDDDIPRRQRGRPSHRLSPIKSVDETLPRRRGRPTRTPAKESADSNDDIPPRRRGRPTRTPAKESANSDDDIPPRRRGRPSRRSNSVESDDETPPRRRGRLSCRSSSVESDNGTPTRLRSRPNRRLISVESDDGTPPRRTGRQSRRLSLRINAGDTNDTPLKRKDRPSSTVKSVKETPPRRQSRPTALGLPKKTNTSIATENSLSEPSELESSDEYIPTESGSDRSTEEDDFATPKRLSPMETKGTPKTVHTFSAKRKLMVNNYDEYIVNADDYFLKKREPTSNKTMKLFRDVAFGEKELERILMADYVRHKEIENLAEDNASKFGLWMAYLKQNFSLLLYGLGSKLKLMEEFRSRMLSGYAVLTVKGFLPKIALKQILSSLVKDILGESTCPVNPEEALVTITNLMRRRESPVFVIVLNIDGPGLRQMKYQSVLSKLSMLPNLHLIATVDHINAPLLFGNKTLGQFNFVWIVAHTFLPYMYETRMLDASRTQSRVSDDLSSLTNILAPCPDKIKKIFRIILEDHVENKGNRKYQGVPFDELFKRVKQKMLAYGSSDLNSKLYEFYEHNILKKTNNRLFIPIHVDTLTQFYEEYFGSSN